MNKYMCGTLLGVGLLMFGGCRVFESKPMHEAPPPPQGGVAGGGEAGRGGQGGGGMEPTPYGGGTAGQPGSAARGGGGPASSGAGGMGRPLGAPLQGGPAGAGRGQAANGNQYTIQKGDTLWSIAKDNYGDGNRWQDIAQANPGLNPKRLIVGQTITLP